MFAIDEEHPAGTVHKISDYYERDGGEQENKEHQIRDVIVQAELGRNEDGTFDGHYERFHVNCGVVFGKFSTRTTSNTALPEEPSLVDIYPVDCMLQKEFLVVANARRR